MNQTSLPTRSSRRGFTLVELMLVIVLMGIIAVSVLPAMGNVQIMREGAARDDLARMLDITRSRALATGTPTGVRIDLNDSTISLVETENGTSITPLIDPLTYNPRMLDIDDTYTRVTIESMTNGNGDSGSGYVWFDFDATPHTRSGSGAFESDNQEQVEIELSSGQSVIVHPYSGVVELR